MLTHKEIVTKFIQTAFDCKSSWDDVSLYADGNGKYTHPLFSIPSIRELYNAISSFRSVFPDLNQEVVAVALADDGHVYVKTNASATFLGDFEAIKANGRRWQVPVFWEFELDNGKVIAASELASHHAINQQLGIALFKAPFEIK